MCTVDLWYSAQSVQDLHENIKLRLFYCLLSDLVGVVQHGSVALLETPHINMGVLEALGHGASITCVGRPSGNKEHMLETALYGHSGGENDTYN